MRILVTRKRPSVLAFDTECRPMHYSDWRREDQITAIAWSWVGSEEVHSRVLEQDLSNEATMLWDFLEAFNTAGIVTGHYIHKHDLPLLSDHSLRLGFPVLRSVMVQDTHRIVAVKGLGKSQENLSAALGVDAEKHPMGGHRWRVANALDAAGREEARVRVTTDVIQQKALRVRLLELGALKPPRRWAP